MAGRSPASTSSRATSATTGVLPRPPMARLPTLTTGAVNAGGTASRGAVERAWEAPAVAIGLPSPERMDNGPEPRARQQSVDGVDGPALRAAVGVDERTGGRADARAFDRIAEEPDDHFPQVVGRLHLNGRALAQELVGNLREVLHVRTEDDRLAVHGRFQDVVPALPGQARPHEDDGGNLQEA